jgi:hypothetical protein
MSGWQVNLIEGALHAAPSFFCAATKDFHRKK